MAGGMMEMTETEHRELSLATLIPFRVVTSGQGTISDYKRVGTTLCLGPIIEQYLPSEEGLADLCLLAMLGLQLALKCFNEKKPIPDLLFAPVEAAVNRIVAIQEAMSREALAIVYQAAFKDEDMLEVFPSRAGLILVESEKSLRYVGNRGMVYLRGEALQGRLGHDDAGFFWETSDGSQHRIEADALAYYDETKLAE